jgi:hypothetical protein
VLWIVFFLGVAAEPAEAAVAEPLEPHGDVQDDEAPPDATPLEAPQEPADPAPVERDPAASGSTPLEPEPVLPPPKEAESKPARGPVARDAHVVRVSLAFGPAWRIREVDPLLTAGVEYGRAHGFSGVFHASLIPRERRRASAVPAVTEATMGVGAVARGRLKRPLDGSIGLTAGIRIHRAATDIGVMHRVDPDFTLPIQGAWTIRGIGLHVAVVPGYSVRARAYESRGEVVWRRSAFRVGLLFGLHWDVIVHRDAAEGSGRTGRRRR